MSLQHPARRRSRQVEHQPEAVVNRTKALVRQPAQARVKVHAQDFLHVVHIGDRGLREAGVPPVEPDVAGQAVPVTMGAPHVRLVEADIGAAG